ncbi:ImmA/IrrE family metallo-endopeptidase [Methylotenera versatilis]|uniref:ImmA/IrrE family metallo-endopeptidase n=1 Tax=Methylotenera versatilis TaxID=1055487 RepID=UPI000646CFBD|nr:ImmA/IrrE family metallo-endopeptidase [Methylotenera versatilis]
MSLRRGFKSEANQIARQIRDELGLKYFDPLNPLELASYLEIKVIPISNFGEDAPAAIKHFKFDGKYEFSAATIFSGTERLILHNDSHTAGRQSSNISHELSHSLLHHPKAAPLNDLGCRNWDNTIESEADWLGGALLISEEAALKIARENLPLRAAANLYGVTEQMIRFRLNVTGSKQRVSKVVMP